MEDWRTTAGRPLQGFGLAFLVMTGLYAAVDFAVPNAEGLHRFDHWPAELVATAIFGTLSIIGVGMTSTKWED